VLVDTFLVPASGFVTARFDFHSDTTIGAGVTSVRFDDAASPNVNGATFNLHAVSQGTGIEETTSRDDSILLYPNPVLNELRIKNADLPPGQAGLKIEIEMFNSTGEKVYETHQTSVIGHPTIISAADLPSGIYFIKLHGEKGERIAKFIRQ